MGLQRAIHGAMLGFTGAVAISAASSVNLPVIGAVSSALLGAAGVPLVSQPPQRRLIKPRKLKRVRQVQ